ncbi:ATP-binding protein [Planomonospora venezuelensis]|uniref:ATP-binding protein n=1 Tax=Planomonospora venezuelensis TaxID=1999 RepID=A0A841D3F3_PLAVE|nr:ATP-binding protein [Planomonospora venezuelensis]MBB5962695.1 hypothetical protein [Planomonospora venezuelensis]GIN01630.1 hypothetical protein Pve01_32880 [Planomonospora venezuelensis]
MSRLIPRAIEPLLHELASGLRIVIVNGPRQSGKTTLLRQAHAVRGGQYVTLDDEKTLAAALEDPVSFVRGRPRPLIIDEIQRGGDKLVRAIKMAVDESRDRGQFILSGSSKFLTIPTLSESLAGRAGFLDLWPLSLSERVAGPIDFIERVFEEPQSLIGARSEWSREDYLEAIIRGGYPETFPLKSDLARSRWYEGYASTILNRDITDFAQVHHVGSLSRLLVLIAARAGSPAVLADLARDADLGRDTVRNYLSYLNMVFLTNDLQGWAANLNTRAAKTPRTYITDSGLATQLLSVTRAKLRTPGHRALGGLLETFVVAELTKLKAMSLSRVDLYFYRDSNDHEVDIVLESPRGEVVAIEVKASVSPGLGAAKHLVWLREKLGDRFVAGVVLHLGEQALSFGDRILSLPVSALWGHTRLPGYTD